MKKITEKISSANKNLALTIVFSLVLMIGFTGHFQFSEAQENPPGNNQDAGGEEQTEGASEAAETKCVTDLQAYGEQEMTKYRQFMEEHFANKDSTGSLLDAAIDRYLQLENDFRSKYQEIFQQQVGNAGARNYLQGEYFTDCQEVLNNYLTEGRKLVEMRATTTSTIKKTSVFVEKYKQINDKLRAMNLEVLRMTVNISTFEQKLPCYLKNCV
ncbi:MAG: hypothetical protein ACRCZE_04985 [Candidatus Altimarinota bacterium]